MAYGQTGTGKTFTLGKLGDEDTADRGIMVRALEDILANINHVDDTVTVSYLQVQFNSGPDLKFRNCTFSFLERPDNRTQM